MPSQLVAEFKNLNLFQKLLLAAVIFILIGYGLLHAGLIKLPAAKAYDCSTVTGAEIKVMMQNGVFLPKNVNAKVCDKLIFINKDNILRWPAVGPHPTHTSYPGFDAERGLSQGEEFSFVLNRAGSYTFHDHLEDQMQGTITITPP